MADIAGWVALVATCTAALMTASNLGARVTGWGFVVFTIGALAWIVVGFTTDQTQLLWSNAFLMAVDIWGIWRWLGRQARFEDAAKSEQARAERRASEQVFAVGALCDMPVKAADGEVVAHAVDAMTGCGTGGIHHLLIREGGVAGVGETLRRLPWSQVCIRDGAVETDLDQHQLLALPVAEAG